MTTDSLAVSKPVPWIYLEKFQNLLRAIKGNDLSNCGGPFNSVYLTVARARSKAILEQLLKVLVWKESGAFFNCGTQSWLNRIS